MCYIMCVDMVSHAQCFVLCLIYFSCCLSGVTWCVLVVLHSFSLVMMVLDSLSVVMVVLHRSFVVMVVS